MLVEPKEGSPKKKAVSNKLCHWCPTCKPWARHAPEGCEGKSVKSSAKGSAKGSAKDDKKLKLGKALPAVVEGAEESGSNFE